MQVVLAAGGARGSRRARPGEAPAAQGTEVLPVPISRRGRNGWKDHKKGDITGEEAGERQVPRKGEALCRDAQPEQVLRNQAAGIWMS